MTEGIQNVNASPRTSGLASVECAIETTLSCSVVVCTRDRPDHLNRCLEAFSALVYPRYDILVVDNAPSDSRTKEVAERWGANYIVEPRVGLSRARNLGARSSRSDIIAFTDDDSVVDSDWLTNLITEFSDPEVMAVTGRILPLRNEEQTADVFAYALDLGDQKRIIDRSHPLWFEIASFGGLGDGVNMAFRRRAFDLWSGFDERLGRGTPIYGGEEHRAFCTVVEHGFRVVYAPQAIVYHWLPCSLQEIGRGYLKSLSASTAYMTLLLVETRHRWKTLKYLLGAAGSRHRSWRGCPEKSPSSLVPRWRKTFACLAGPLIYVRTCLRAQW